MATYRKWAAERRVDGVIVVDLRVDDPRIPLLRKLELPAVLVGDPALVRRDDLCVDRRDNGHVRRCPACRVPRASEDRASGRAA